jgi:hypothetical protein
MNNWIRNNLPWLWDTLQWLLLVATAVSLALYN